ncbi:MAG: Tim44 domain-containing protein [Alphaproteobacteria bacterium]|nr:Tim44 domain-containing protein [Alphaproteobacteria bacterium]
MMNMFSDPLNLLLLVAAVTIFMWLRSVLGQRTGFENSERPIEILPPVDKISSEPAKAMKMVSNDWAKYSFVVPEIAQIDQLNMHAPEFDLEHFMSGAKMAHEMILVAFAGGDKKSLKPLLTKQVFESFEVAINENHRTGKTNLFKFVGVKSAKIAALDIQAKIVAITVMFDTDLVLHEQNSIVTQRENWIFERDMGSKDPNWRLAATDDQAIVQGAYQT